MADLHEPPDPDLRGWERLVMVVSLLLILLVAWAFLTLVIRSALW